MRNFPKKVIQILLENNMKKIDKKILIVEDDPNFLIILQKKFESEGFSVIGAEDGKDCLNLLENEKPDMIVSDILLPRLDGIEMAKKIKKGGGPICRFYF